MIALFIAGFFCMFIAFTTGVVGCWKTAPGHIVSSAIMMLLACKYTYRKVTSSKLSRLVAHSRIFRLCMKGKFDAYVV